MSGKSTQIPTGPVQRWMQCMLVMLDSLQQSLWIILEQSVLMKVPCLCICCICHHHSIHTTSYPSFPLLEVQDTKISNAISHWLPFPQALKSPPNVTTSQLYSPSLDVKSLGEKLILLVWSDYLYVTALFWIVFRQQSPPWPQPNAAITNTTRATATTTTTTTTTATNTTTAAANKL